ncbi:hypothetical protein QR680_013378 [Steinernema hermaphroditum]|uniref:Uncharacterized protein n=1 Tax=Steinernema hermaphroditum TaxID=289476 RepID=A0AA39I5B8_9BILA|nr:hypothetical protein QR680_013378 [Steinernema hermaphroditum]
MTVPLPPEEREALQAMSALLSNRMFQKLWIENTTKALLHPVCEPEERCCSGRGNTNRSKAVVVRRVLDELSHQVHLALETFARSVDLALCHFEASASNRDSSNLYSAQVHIERFLSEKEFVLSHFEQNSRRVSQLLRLFTKRISTPFHIANCAFFARILADILFRFEECCVIQGRVPTTDTQVLKRAIDEFNFRVVQSLNARIIEAKRRGIEGKAASPNKKAASPGTLNDFLAQRTPPKSYLLPDYLERARRKTTPMQPKRSQSAYSGLSTKTNSRGKETDSEALRVAQQLVKESMPQIAREVESALHL